MPCYDHGGYPDREGSLRWRLTDDLADLRLDDGVFIACGGHDELVAALEARFESRVAGLSRVEPVPPASTYDAARGRYVPRSPTDACVYTDPLVDPWLTAHDGSLGEHALVAGLSEMAASGPLLITRDGLARVQGRALFDSDLTTNDTDPKGAVAPRGYLFLKSNPVMAQARRTREANAARKRTHAALLNRRTAALRSSILAAAGQMYAALCGVEDGGLTRVLARPEDAAQDRSRGTLRTGGHGDTAATTDRYGRVLYPWWDGSRVLRAYARVYDTYFGRGGHRKLAGFREALAALRDVREVKGIGPRDYGCDSAVTAWFDGELKARKPKRLDPAGTAAARGPSPTSPRVRVATAVPRTCEGTRGPTGPAPLTAKPGMTPATSGRPRPFP